MYTDFRTLRIMLCSLAGLVLICVSYCREAVYRVSRAEMKVQHQLLHHFAAPGSAEYSSSAPFQ